MFYGKLSIFLEQVPNMDVSYNHQLVFKVQYLVIIEVVSLFCFANIQVIFINFLWNVLKVDNPDRLWFSCEILIHTTTKNKKVTIIHLIRLKQRETDRRVKPKVNINLSPGTSTIFLF